MSNRVNAFLFWITTILIILIAHHVMTFGHEWTHGLMAWLAGYKQNPFDIHYSSNWITLWGIDEAVPYQKILADGNNGWVAAIAIAPMIDGALFVLLGLKLLSLPAVQKRWLLLSFFYWWTLMELAEIYSYIPIRTFVKMDDIHNFIYATGLSPWVVFVIGVPFVIWGLWKIIGKEEVRACIVKGRMNQFFFLFISLLIIFWYFSGLPFIFAYPQVAKNIFSWISLGMIPICLIVLRKRYT